MRAGAGAVDCVLIGFNDFDFPEYVQSVAATGRHAGAFQDVRLSYVDIDGQPLRALDVLSRYHQPVATRRFHNADFLWPVITYLGTFLARHGFTFDYVNLFQEEKERLADVLRSGRVRTVAITTTLYVSPHPIQEIVGFVRDRAPDVTIIVGGPYIANLMAAAHGPGLEAALSNLGADIYVVGREGELALSRTLAALRDGRELHAVDNLVFRQGSGWVYTRQAPESNSLSENMVDYKLFPPSAFTEFVTTRTAKSCPFSCSFCGFPQRAGKYTYLELADVERELDNIAALPGISAVTFIDDTFNVPKVRFREILQLMIDKRYRFRWNSYYRSDHGDARTIDMMRQAGCEGVFLGIESGSDEQLSRMNKTARRADYLSALREFRRAGISTYASLIVGFPGETAETVAETESLLVQGQPDFFRAQLWYCDPVTPIWQRRKEFGIAGRGFTWRHDTMDAAEACAHIERIFGSIDSPIWMPQYGFEQWSVFYLLRRGMSMEGIKDFLRAFNAVVREQIRHPDRAEIHPALLDRLISSCQFDEAPISLAS
ncbi:PhpK family radical SAM P-methyltransferase [Allorhizocola rhizosphaerae]|uniref:PhpK family radical SAM P-methyltransferase n=1 Tax=Allorhizocola rhizosphaerae TaxID=1872709 RepID=UPI0013C36834|nr:PhpK family radical SAM P-methyltransferase [Allorhizocola rhizosphaerae]